MFSVHLVIILIQKNNNTSDSYQLPLVFIPFCYSDLSQLQKQSFNLSFRLGADIPQFYLPQISGSLSRRVCQQCCRC